MEFQRLCAVGRTQRERRHLPRAARAPNVISHASDDKGWGDVGFRGHPHRQTPGLDATAAGGLRCDRW